MNRAVVNHLLISPLDWGTGHCTRCIPIIRIFRALGFAVTVAGNERQRDFLASVFPDLQFLPLEGYDVRYTRTNGWFALNIIRQLPRVLSRIAAERRWLEQALAGGGYSLVISDNRYGLRHPSVPCVFITHQLRVRSGLGALADDLLQRLHYRAMRRFTQIWTPDAPQFPGLAGTLSHPKRLPPGHRYIGPLSALPDERTTRAEAPGQIIDHRTGARADVAGPITNRVAGRKADGERPGDGSLNESPEGALLILLSGPEPQRSILQSLLWEECLPLRRRIVFVAGSKAASVPDAVPEHMSFHAQCTPEEVAAHLYGAALVVCRSGYSTIMDLIALRKPAILIPTPGQTEQEYLARSLAAAGWFAWSAQPGLALRDALASYERSLPAPPEMELNGPLLRDAAAQFV